MPVIRRYESSLSRKEIPPGTGARVRIAWFDEDMRFNAMSDEHPDFRFDVTTEEALELVHKYNAEAVEPRPDRRKRRPHSGSSA